MSPLVARRVVSLRCQSSNAIGREADMAPGSQAGRFDATDPGCVKTHTSAKCRKNSSPTSHRISRVQYGLTLTNAIALRYFYVWRKAWSFYTAKTRSRL